MLQKPCALDVSAAAERAESASISHLDMEAGTQNRNRLPLARFFVHLGMSGQTADLAGTTARLGYSFGIHSDPIAGLA